MPPPRVGHFLLALFCLSVQARFSFSQDVTPTEACIEGRVVDVHGAPIPDAYVIQKAIPGSDEAGPLRMPVNQDGSFRMLAPKADPSAFGVYVIARGYATREFTQHQLRGRFIEAVLKPDVKLNVRVVGPDGDPIPGALVTGNWNGLPISQALRLRLGETTNQYGEAELNGFSLEKDVSVVSEVPGHGIFAWLFPNSISEKRIWKLVCPRHRASLQISVIDHAGAPVRNATVWISRPSEEVNRQVMQEAGLVFHASQRTSEFGQALFDNVVCEEVEVNVNVKQGANRITQVCKTPTGKKSNVVLQLPKTAQVVIPLVAPQELLDRRGIQIHFVSASGSHQFRSKTNEDGLIEVELEPGVWSYYPIDGIPPGYAFSGPAPTVTVDASLEIQKPMPIYLSKARLIEGKILGVDFTREPYNWMLVENKKNPDYEMQPAGRINRHGYFKLWVAEDILDEDLDNFQTPVRARGTTMEVVSKSPWVLSPRKEPVAKD